MALTTVASPAATGMPVSLLCAATCSLPSRPALWTHLTRPAPDAAGEREMVVGIRASGREYSRTILACGRTMERKVRMRTEPHGNAREGRAQYARRMDRESSVLYMDCLFSVLAGSDDNGGRFGLMEMVAPKGREPSRHLHHTDDVGFYVLDGELTLYVGEEVYEASPCTFVFLPHGIPHSYTFETDEVRMLSITAPGGLERHFRDPRFSEPAKGMTLPRPAEAPDPDVL